MSVLRTQILQHLQDHSPHIFRPQEEDIENGGQTGRDPDPVPVRARRLLLCADPAGGGADQRPGGDIPAAGEHAPRRRNTREHPSHGRATPHRLPLLSAQSAGRHLLGAPAGAHG